MKALDWIAHRKNTSACLVVLSISILFISLFPANQQPAIKISGPLLAEKRSTKKRKGKRLFCVKHAHTHVQSGVKAIVLSLKNLRPIARSLIVSLLSTTTSRVILLLVRIKSKSITDPKRTSRGFVNQGNWEVGRLGGG